jgi:YidC/Oxa1 family membrane protein insertase
MWSSIWHGVFFDPIYNGLIFITNLVPGADVGIAIVVLTIVVKTILLPLSLKAAETQHKMRFLEPELARVKEKFKDKREEIAKATMEAYKKAGINPFASILLALIQIPVIIALYLAVYSGGGVKLPEINTALLYSFIQAPGALSMHFLGIIDIASRSIVLALLAGGTQYISGHLSLPPLKPKAGDKPNLKEDFARSMQIQMKYAMPVVITVIGYQLPSAVALYFVVSNLTAIAQEYVLRMRIPDRHADVVVHEPADDEIDSGKKA